DIAESGAHHASYTRNKGDRVDPANSDKLYADIPSLRANFRLQDPRFLTTEEEVGDDTTTQIRSLFPTFVLQQLENSVALPLASPSLHRVLVPSWLLLPTFMSQAAMRGWAARPPGISCRLASAPRGKPTTVSRSATGTSAPRSTVTEMRWSGGMAAMSSPML